MTCRCWCLTRLLALVPHQVRVGRLCPHSPATNLVFRYNICTLTSLFSAVMSDSDAGDTESDDDCPSTLPQQSSPHRSGEQKQAEFLTPPSNKPRRDYHPGWTAKKSSPLMVTATHTASGSTYTVPETKFNKAVHNLNPSTFAFILNPTKEHCRCCRVCTQREITVPMVLRSESHL